MTPEAEQKILAELRDRAKRSIEDDGENRKLALDDLEFIAIEGKQWPEDVKAKRVAAGRPCITINKAPVFIDQVVGEQRMNRPQIKIIPADSLASSSVAKILSGWVKHVQYNSKADIATDHGFEHATACGYGAIRVITDYISDNSFDQDAFIKKIDNALAVYWGPHSEYDASDAEYCFIVSDMERDEYKDKYNDTPMPFNQTDSQYVEGWATSKTVRLAEYFVKEYKEKTICLIAGGAIIDKKDLEEGQAAIKERKVNACTIKWYLCSGNKVLEEKTWVGKKYIPVVPIWGKELNVGGKRIIRGLIRNSKDSQRMFNYWNSLDTEIATLQPKIPYLITPKQIQGHEAQWKSANTENYPYLLVNFDEKAPGWPKRETPPQASSAMVERIRQTDQDYRDTMGLQKASLGMQSNERSGAAIRERKIEGDTGTFAYVDNLTRSLEQVGRILIDVAPGILDTERVIRLIQEDGSATFEGVNVQDQSGKIMNDLSVGSYGAVVTVGPSFATQRSEARESMKAFIQYYPQAAPVIGDLYAKNMDWPGADEVSKRLEFLLPPEIKARKAAEEAMREGKPAPPPAPPPPPPPIEVIKLEEAKLKLEEEKLKLEEAKLKLEQEKAKLAGIHMKNEMSLADSKEKINQIIDEFMNEVGGTGNADRNQGGQSIQEAQGEGQV